VLVPLELADARKERRKQGIASPRGWDTIKNKSNERDAHETCSIRVYTPSERLRI